MKRKNRSRDMNCFLKWWGHSFSKLTSTYKFLYKGVWMPERGFYVAAIHILNLHMFFTVKGEEGGEGNHCVKLKGVIHSFIHSYECSEVFHCDILELVCIIKIIILWGFVTYLILKFSIPGQQTDYRHEYTIPIDLFPHSLGEPPFLSLYTFCLLYQLVALVMGGSSLLPKTLTCSSLCEKVSKYFRLKIYIIIDSSFFSATHYLNTKAVFC